MVARRGLGIYTYSFDVIYIFNTYMNDYSTVA